MDLFKIVLIFSLQKTRLCDAINGHSSPIVKVARNKGGYTSLNLWDPKY